MNGKAGVVYTIMVACQALEAISGWHRGAEGVWEAGEERAGSGSSNRAGSGSEMRNANFFLIQQSVRILWKTRT